MGRRQFGRIRRLASGRWQARYPAPDGVDRSLGTYDTKLAAHRALVSLEQTITRGDWVSPALRDQTLSEYARTWLASRQLRLRTRESYEDQLRLRILPQLGAFPLSKITPRHVRGWYGALVQLADAAGRGHRAATSSYRVLRAILNTAVQDEILLRNPCALRGASTDRPNDRPMVDEHDVWALAEAVPDLYRAVVWLAAGTALRTAELAGLRRTDVDLPNRRLTVRQTYVEPARGNPYFGPPKSDAGSRTVVLPSVVVPILQEHLDRYSQPGNVGLIFVSEKGQPLSRHNRKWWRLACKEAGLPTGTRLHDLRHAGLTIAAQSGATLKELMALAGHSSPRAALIYQHAASSRAVVVADAVSARLSRSAESGRADPTA
ncbi:MAG: site-specific integrase [Actinomycetota bacterium]|nr:site-specific integrase [Actinomycetota bacterium]